MARVCRALPPQSHSKRCAMAACTPWCLAAALRMPAAGPPLRAACGGHHSRLSGRSEHPVPPACSLHAPCRGNRSLAGRRDVGGAPRVARVLPACPLHTPCRGNRSLAGRRDVGGAPRAASRAPVPSALLGGPAAAFAHDPAHPARAGVRALLPPTPPAPAGRPDMAPSLPPRVRPLLNARRHCTV